MSTLVGGRPGLRFLLESYFLAIRRRCQARRVSGVTMLAKRTHENLPPNWLALGGQSTALIVVEARPFAQLLLEDSDLLLEVFDYELLALIHPTPEANKQKT